MSHGSQDKGGFVPVGSVEHDRRNALVALLNAYNDDQATLEELGSPIRGKALDQRVRIVFGL